MRFTLIDRVLEVEPGRKITAVKNLSLAEEYLADHFPGFPVMPGVLMLQAMTEAGSWLVRVSEDFRPSTVLLKEARNIKYASFVQPGQTLRITAEITAQEGKLTKIKAEGSVEGNTVVSGKLVLEHYNLAEEDPQREQTDQILRRKMRELYALMAPPGENS